MQRREFLTLAGSAAAWPFVARAQQTDQIRRVGVLMSGIETDPQQKTRWDSFRKSLEGLGWLEGRNLHIEVRFAGGPGKFEPLAKEIVALQPDAIFVHSTGFVAAVARQTRTIPIVFANVSDPIGAGFVATLARPGANITGLVLLESSIAGKWLSMLKEMVPRLKRAALVGNPKTSPYDYFLRTTQAAAPALGIEMVSNRVDNVAELASSLE
jgi:putative ABC transport system substrate-binding protein